MQFAVWWHAPFYSGGGYSSEAVAFMLALWSSPALSRRRLRIAQHGDGFSKEAYRVSIAMDQITALLLAYLH